MLFEDADIIHSYSRAQVIEDGVLVDVSETAREAGITFPVAMTCGAFERCVAVPRELEGLQDVAGRLWDVLWMLRCAVKASRGGSLLVFKLSVLQPSRRQGGRPRAQLVELKAQCGPGDHAEPVITIMLPEED